MEVQIDRMAEEPVNPSRRNGQALLELAIILPFLLFLFYGMYSSVRISHLNSRAESAVFAEAVRTGRRLPGIEQELSSSISSERNSVRIRSGLDGNIRLAQIPLPSLAGRTTASAKVLKTWNEIGNPSWLPSLTIQRHAVASVDCWGNKTSSGNKIRRAVQGAVILGSFR